MSNETVVVNEQNQDSSVIINENDESTNVVVINDVTPGFDQIINIFNIANGFINEYNNILGNSAKIDSVLTHLIANSSLYLNLQEVEEVNIIQSLTGKWVETAEEMDTLQELSASFVQASEFILDGIFDAGYF